MDLGLRGKRALVLGGGSGIGFGIAKALANEGVDIAIVSRDRERLQQAAGELGQAGPRVLTAMADLRDIASVRQAWREVEEAFGGVDILVNNTGGPPQSGVVGVGEAQWREQFEAMVLSLIELTDMVLPGMRERKWGRILTVASAGVVQPIRGLAISNTLRSALVGWSKSLANEVASEGITSNVLLAATTRTNRLVGLWEDEAARTGRTAQELEDELAATLPTGRFGTIEEFGAVGAFIASVPAAYVTGSIIRVDGDFITSI